MVWARAVQPARAADCAADAPPLGEQVMSDSLRPKTRRIDLSDAFGPESRPFNVFRRVYTTTLVMSFALYIGGLGLTWNLPRRYPLGFNLRAIIGDSLRTGGWLLSPVLVVTAIIALLVSERARFVLAFWIGLVLCPVVVIWVPTIYM